MHHLIIGTSAAGIATLQKLRQLDPVSQITCISDEPEWPYNKCFLADYLSGTLAPEKIYTRPESYFASNNITLLLGKRVVGLNAIEKKVQLHDGQIIFYDTLFLGTGSSPRLPQWFDYNLQGLFTFHTLADVQKLQGFIAQHAPQQAIVIGGGLSGLECADSLLAQGITVTMVIRSGILRNMVTREGADYIEQRMQEAGIVVIKDEVQEILRGDDTSQAKVFGVRLQSGQVLQAPLIIAATGLQPNSSLAQAAGIPLDASCGGIIVNEYMQTSNSSIYAGGDCAVVLNQFTGATQLSTTWPDAMQHGMIAAHAMANQIKKYAGMNPVISSRFFGAPLVSAGIIHDSSARYELVSKKGDGYHHTFIMDGAILKGFLLIGHTTQWPLYKRMLLTGEPLAIQ